ncbi:hypothetical protein K9L97_06000 [Candidatus Woesearchaeota archaeon]|nr:hypothetical protein [Candidatus Woesearchaeota archaeon]
MATSALGNSIEFMQRLGVFDTVLPFLLVFVLVFAFLEKTKVFGIEDYRSDDGKMFKMTRKNLNAMMAFVIGFFVVASSQLVALISEITSKIVLVLVLIVMFMMTVGVMYKEEEKGFELSDKWKSLFAVISFIAIALIFLDSLGWLTSIFNFLENVWGSEATASLILIALVIGIVMYATKDNKPAVKKETKTDS